MISEVIIRLSAQIRDCKTIDDLDKLREDLVIETKKNPEYFRMMQLAFIKKKNQIKYNGDWD